MSHIPLLVDTKFLDFIQIFLKVEAAFWYSGNLYFNILYPMQLVQTDFLLSGNSIFLVRAILLLVETIIGIRRKQFPNKKLIVASGQMKRHFQWNPLLRLVQTDFLARGNRFLLFRDFSSKWKSSLKLVEANF